MADIQANIGIGVDTSQALAAIRQLQREISVFHTLMAKGGASAAAKSMQMQQGLINTINETGKFSASMTRISSSTESFTNALEKNKLSMTQYFRYAGGASRTFGKMFTREFNTINKVATERVKDLQTQYISMGRDANGALQSIKVRPLALDMDNLGTKVQLAAQKQQIFNQLMKQGTTNLLNFGKNTQWAGRQLMVGFTIPLTIFGATAAREFQKLEEQAVKFRRVYGDMFTTEADTEKALANVRELAEEFTKYGIAVEKTIGLAAKVAQMGNVGSDLTAQVTQATKLAVLGGMEQEEALDTTISLTNAFGIAAEDLAGKIAFLNAAENQTILAIEDFNEAIPKAGSVVQQLGGDVEDLAFFLTAMREGGINASQAANALKSSLGRLINPTEVAKKELAGFGIDIVGIVEGNVGDLRGTVMQLGYALEELDPLNRARAIEQLFGKFQFARMSTMFQNIVKDGSQANKILQLTTATTEELAIIAERELKRVEESPAFRLQKQMEQLKAALAPIGEEFIKAVGPLLEFGTKLLKSFNNLGDGSKQFIVVLTAIAGVIAPAALMAFGLIANGVANLIKFIKFLSDAFGMLSGRSTMLGGQTEYMTQQQLEAAAVAASLGQSHSNLTQVFTAEASAISRLVEQYRAAIVAQRQLSIGQTAAGVAARGGARPRGFAKGGIIRGPGTETSDSIIAMLSDGEAVIPAKQVKKYGAVVEQLISGNIPGYALGEIIGGPGAYKAYSPSAMMGEGNTGKNPISMSWLRSSPVAPISATSAIKTERERATGTGYDDISAEGQAAAEYAGQKLQEHAQNTESFASAAQQAYQDTLKHLQEQVAANKMTAQEAEEIATATRTTLAPTREDVLKGEVSYPRQGYEERDGVAVAGRIRSERSGASNKDRARNRLERELVSSGYSEEDAKATATDKKLSFAHVQESESLSREEAAALGIDTSPRLRQKSQKTPAELELLRKKEAGQIVSRGTPLQTPDGAGADPQLVVQADQDGDGYIQNLKSSISEGAPSVIPTLLDAGGWNSPHPTWVSQGSEDGEGYQDAFEAAASGTGKPPLPGNLAAPKPPVQPEAAQPGRFGKFFSSAKDKINESKIAQRAADYLSGEDLTDKITLQPGMSDAEREAHRTAKAINQDLFDKGLITEDMQATPLGQTQGVTPVRVVDGQIDIGDNSVDQLADASPAANDAAEQDKLTKATKDQRAAQEELAEATQATVKTQEQKDKDDKAALKEQKRQGRQAVAGKALMGLGSITAGLGAATQLTGVEVAGINVGETAQKLLPVAGALTGILPMLLALGPVLGGLVAVVGLVAYGFYKYNQMLNEVTKNARELAENLGSGSKAMKLFAEAAGKATATEIMTERRQAGVIGTAIGKSEYGESFVGSEQGQQYVETVKKGFEELGKDQTIAKVRQQLATAVYSGIFTVEQASGIAVEVSRAIGELGVGIDVAGDLVGLFGPDGSNLLTNPLQIAMELLAVGEEEIEMSMQNLIDKILNPEKMTSIWDILNDEEAAARLAGDLVAFAGQRQEILDAEQVRAESERDRLQGEGRAALAAGDTAAANEYFAEADAVMEAYLENRTKILADAAAASKMYTDQAQRVLDITSDLPDGDPFRGTRGGRGGRTQEDVDADIQGVRDLLTAYEELMGVDLGDIENMEVDLLEQVYNENLQAIKDLEPLGKGFNNTLVELGKIVKAQNEDNKVLADQIDSLIESEGSSLLFKQSVLEGLATGVFDPTDIGSFLTNFNADVNAVTDDAIEDFKRSASNSYEAQWIASLSEDEIKEEIARRGRVVQDAFANINQTLGQGAGQQMVGIFDRVGVEQERQFTLKVDAMVQAGQLTEAEEMINTFSSLLELESDTIKPEVVFDFYLNNKDEYDKFNASMSELENLFAKSPDGKINYETVLTSTILEAGELSMNAFKANQEYFDSLDPFQQKVYLRALLTIEDTFTSEDFNAWKRENPWVDYAGIDQSVQLEMFLQAEAEELSGLPSFKNLFDEEPKEEPPGSGSGPQLDSLLKKLRDVRDASIDLKKGWEGMQEVLSSIFAGGTKELNIFDGLEKQLRDLKLGPNLIAMLVGMDPDEFEKRKSELFNVDGTATDALINMNKAFNAVAIGDYVNGQEQFIQKTRDQTSAIRILVANGLDLADAYEAVQDEATAAAIAQGATTEQIKEILRVTKLAKQVEEELEEQRERSRISEAVRKTNEEFSNQVAILKQLSKEQGKYSDEQVKAIMGDSDLQKLYLDPTIDEKALEAALQNAAEKANLEVQIAIAEGREEELFGQYLTDINDYFSKEQAVIDVTFEADTAADNDLIRDAQNQIAAIQYQLDDYNAELERISWQEEDINEKYDKRTEALENVAKANERINNLQKAQLDIAEALSRGDVAAAARAQQELRTQQAQAAEEAQKETLQKQREKELAAVRSASGLGREEIEDLITTLERQIFEIEEASLEPAQERIRLAEITRDLAIEQIELNGMAREEFDAIAAATSLAAINMEDMATSAEKLVAMGQFIQTGTKPANWEELFPMPKAAPAPAPARSSGGGGQPPKGQWYNPNTGNTIEKDAELAGYSSWQSYYNANRSGIDPVARVNKANGGMIVPKRMAVGGMVGGVNAPPLQMAMGGKVKGYPMGGLIPYKSNGGFFKSLGSDTVPAMLTPGEYVVRRPAVKNFGVKNLEDINRGTYSDGSVYNYNLNVNVKSDSDPNRIANTVMRSIKQVEGQRIRGNRI